MGHPVWETCLRSIAIVPDPAEVKLNADDEVFAEEQAFGFLLEVICGLHSPIVGETEVFGQFKKFAKEWQKAEPHRAALIQRFLTEAKDLRTRYLTNLGTQSYGGWLKRKIQSRRLHFLGAGQLVREIVPYLQKSAEDIFVHARDPRKVDFAGVHPQALDERAFDHGALIIAAPIPALEIQRWLGSRVPDEIFDLRGESATDPLIVGDSPHCGLAEIFAEIEKTKSRLIPLVQKVRGEIRARGERLTAKGLVRPMGWDDICA